MDISASVKCCRINIDQNSNSLFPFFLSPGWAGAIPIALSVLLAPPMQVIIDRFSYRPVAIVSFVLSSAGVIATSFVPNMILVYFTYSMVYGGGAAGVSLVITSLIVDYFPAKNCVRALAVALSGTSIGTYVHVCYTCMRPRSLSTDIINDKEIFTLSIT